MITHISAKKHNQLNGILPNKKTHYNITLKGVYQFFTKNDKKIELVKNWFKSFTMSIYNHRTPIVSKNILKRTKNETLKMCSKLRFTYVSISGTRTR